jgi:hypothetical protein
MQRRGVYIGFDRREADAFAVARSSMRRRATLPVPINGLILGDLQARGLYRRPTSVSIDATGAVRIVDHVSARDDYDGRISTEHANARFLVPYLHGSGAALFADGDILVRSNIWRVFDEVERDPSKALWCVKHDHDPKTNTKMDGQTQTKYARKNWSSVMLFNCDHPATSRLTIEMVNTLPGRDLHRFCWLDDHEIGELDVSWNWLVGHSSPEVEPKLVHFTDGVPSMAGYADVPFADEWQDELYRWAS